MTKVNCYMQEPLMEISHSTGTTAATAAFGYLRRTGQIHENARVEATTFQGQPALKVVVKTEEEAMHFPRPGEVSALATFFHEDVVYPLIPELL